MPPDDNRPTLPFSFLRRLRQTLTPRIESTPTPTPSVLDNFLGSSFRDKFIIPEVDFDENGEESGSSDEMISTTEEPSEAFNAKQDKADTGFLTYPRGVARWIYPFDFQDKRSRDSRVERLLSFFFELGKMMKMGYSYVNIKRLLVSC